MIEITSPITGERIQVGLNDFEKEMNWDEASQACKDIGNGWRLPTKLELEVMYKELYKKGVGNFKVSDYWSSTNCIDDHMWGFYFDEGCAENIAKIEEIRVRAVRSI